MVKVNLYHEKLFKMLSMKSLSEKKNFIVRHFVNIESIKIYFILVSKQEIESLCTIFRHLTKGGDKGKSKRS